MNAAVSDIRRQLRVSELRENAREFDAMLSDLQNRLPDMQRFPAIYNRALQVMQSAQQAKKDIAKSTREIDQRYKQLRATYGPQFDRAVSEDNLGAIAIAPWLFLSGVVGALITIMVGERSKMHQIAMCHERARELEKKGIPPIEAAKLACPAAGNWHWSINLAIVGGVIYLVYKAFNL